jgi:hypothetical protein
LRCERGRERWNAPHRNSCATTQIIFQSNRTAKAQLILQRSDKQDFGVLKTSYKCTTKQQLQLLADNLLGKNIKKEKKFVLESRKLLV